MATVKQEYISIKHPFSQDERNDIAAKLAEKQIEIGELEDEKKSAASRYKAEIDARTAEVKLYSRQIKDGFVFLDIYADVHRNFKDKQWEWIDPATGEIVKTKPFEGKDFQMTIDDEADIVDIEHEEPKLLGPPSDDIEYIDLEDSKEEEDENGDED